MAHVRGPRLPGCLALAALLSLVHSQHGKRGAGSCDRPADGGAGPQAGVSTERNRAGPQVPTVPSSGKEPGAPGRTDTDRGSQAIWTAG